jgi:hypothetical protein
MRGPARLVEVRRSASAHRRGISQDRGHRGAVRRTAQARRLAPPPTVGDVESPAVNASARCPAWNSRRSVRRHAGVLLQIRIQVRGRICAARQLATVQRGHVWSFIRPVRAHRSHERAHNPVWQRHGVVKGRL